MGATIFEVQDLSYGTPTGRILQEDISFSVKSGQMLMITGSNGTGKSTLLKALLGQFPLVKGSVVCSIHENGIEYIPQLENTEVHFPLTLRDVLSISRSKRLRWEDVAEIGLLNETQFHSAWNTASGGERKRTLLTRALLRDPSMLIFDEPMNHLDADSRRAMIQMMARFLRGAHSNPRAIVMVCHQGLDDDEHKLFDVLQLNLDDRKVRVAC